MSTVFFILFLLLFIILLFIIFFKFILPYKQLQHFVIVHFAE